MTAPARTKTNPSRAGNGESGSKSKAKTRSRSTTRARSAAAERAYARREERRAQREASERPNKQRTNPGRQPRPVRPKAAGQAQVKKQAPAKVNTSRFPLVVSSMSILGVGLVATLWLSIAAVSGSYELQRREMQIESLNTQKENLVRHNSSSSSAPAIQRQAREVGLGPGSQPAHLVQRPDGSTELVGDPTPAPPAPGSGDQASQREPGHLSETR